MKENNFKVDFIGIGATKSGSTWIFECLKEHPQICGSSKKEIHFFDKSENYNKGLDYYESFFKHCISEKIKGEFTSTYIDSPLEAGIPLRIHKHFPKAKLIVCLRDPIERAYSHYKSSIYTKGQLSTYADFSKAIENHKLVKKGFYYKHLKKYFDIFPRENILVLIYEDIKKDSARFIQEIYNFLGVETQFVPPSIEKRIGFTGRSMSSFRIPFLSISLYKTVRSLNRSGKFFRFLKKIGLKFLYKKVVNWNRKIEGQNISDPSVKKIIDFDTQTKLYQTYKNDINNLERLIGKDLSHWKQIVNKN